MRLYQDEQPVGILIKKTKKKTNVVFAPVYRGRGSVSQGPPLWSSRPSVFARWMLQS